MLKLLVEVPANTERYDQYGIAGKTSQDTSLNCSTSRIALPGMPEQAEAIQRLLYDFRNEINFPYVVDDSLALKELRLHVMQCVLEICLRRELASQGNEASYFTRNLIDLAVIGRIMANLTYNDSSDVMATSSNFEDAIRVISKALGKKEKSITTFVDIPKIMLSAQEFRILMAIGMELILNSVRHAFYNDGTGQLFVALKKVNDEKDVELLVADNGFGPQKLNFGRGLRLVARVSAVVFGDITIRQQLHGGTGVALRFPAARER
jgi:two-component sensor histidine kinase